MKTEIRIKDDLELEPLYSWPNPKPPKPLKKTRAQACREANEKLERDRKAWALRATLNGL